MASNKTTTGTVLKTLLKTNNNKRVKYTAIWKEKEWKLILWLTITNPFFRSISRNNK